MHYTVESSILHFLGRQQGIWQARPFRPVHQIDGAKNSSQILGHHYLLVWQPLLLSQVGSQFWWHLLNYRWSASGRGVIRRSLLHICWRVINQAEEDWKRLSIFELLCGSPFLRRRHVCPITVDERFRLSPPRMRNILPGVGHRSQRKKNSQSVLWKKNRHFVRHSIKRSKSTMGWGVAISRCDTENGENIWMFGFRENQKVLPMCEYDL